VNFDRSDPNDLAIGPLTMGAVVTTKLTNKTRTRLKNALPRRHLICYDVGMRFGWSFVLLLVLGCTSPTLPLPPPEAPTESAGTDPQTVVLVGAGESPTAFIVVENTDTQTFPTQPVAAAIVKEDGTWTVTIQAIKNNQLEITEYIGSEASQTLDFTVLIN
jgi:predicted pyridoxine 5'-phosphate oxidase superfamily flavin-nucleotide-binding protein